MSCPFANEQTLCVKSLCNRNSHSAFGDSCPSCQAWTSTSSSLGEFRFLGEKKLIIINIYIYVSISLWVDSSSTVGSRVGKSTVARQHSRNTRGLQPWLTATVSFCGISRTCCLHFHAQSHVVSGWRGTGKSFQSSFGFVKPRFAPTGILSP